jgi:predicted phosphodiesterase
MLIGILGDLHLTNRSPERRLDNYWETLVGKMTQALEIFGRRNCGYVLQVGDFFDAPTVACKVKAEIIQLLNSFDRVGQKRIFCVYGQHDISGHSKFTLPNSPLAVLQAAGVVNILNDSPQCFLGKDSIVQFYGASFGEPVPEPSEDSYNILVTHRMIGNRPLWPGQELVGPRQFLRKHPDFDLICCGDYHYRFIETWNGRTIINPGAIVRKTILKFDLEHKPAIVIFDTDTSESEVIELKVEPPEKVFNLTREVKRADNQVLADLVEKLKSGGKKLSGWKHFLVKIFDERDTKIDVRNVIDQSLEEVKNVLC